MFKLILGPMYSNKSTELIKEANRYKSIGIKVLTINHIINCRYNTKNISTHDNNVLEANIVTDQLLTIDLENINANVIIIEELQFFQDAFQFITTNMDKKIIIAAGLNGDYNREPFEVISRLIPYAEKIKKLSALCVHCKNGTLANFSKLKISKGDKILVGGINEYEAVCFKHF